MRYSAGEIAAACGISNATFYNWMKQSKELRDIANSEKKTTAVNGAKNVSFGEATRNAFIAEAERRGKVVRQPIDKCASNVRQLENAETAAFFEPSTHHSDNDAKNDSLTFDKATQALIDELKAQNEYLKQKLDEALADNRNYSQAMARMSANIVYLQSENQRLLEAQIPTVEIQQAENTEQEEQPQEKEQATPPQEAEEQQQAKTSIWQKIKNRWGKK